MQTSLNEADARVLSALATDVDFQRPELLAEFGEGLQRRLSTVSEELLKGVRNDELGEVGKLLNELMLTLKGVDVDALAHPGPIRRLWHRFLSEVSLFRGGFEKVNDQLSQMMQRLEADKHRLLADVSQLNALYEQNLGLYQELEELIRGAEAAVAGRSSELDARLGVEDNLAAIQRLRDERGVIAQFEKRIHDLRLTRTLLLQTLPQIRLIQHTHTELVHKIQSAILNTIPVWKNQLLLSLSLARQGRAARVQRRVAETTNAILERNSELLRTSTKEVARLSEAGVLEVEALRKVNSDIVATIAEVLEVYQQGRQQRSQVEAELREMERELKAALALK